MRSGTNKGISSNVVNQLEALDNMVRENMKLTEQIRKDQTEFNSLKTKVEQLDITVRDHTKLVEKSMHEQEKAAGDQFRLLKQSFAQQNTLKTSYAEMLKSTCSEVVTEVNTKLEAMPQLSTQRDEGKTVRDMSCIFDSYLDKDKRKLNVVVHNLPEETGDTPAERSSKDQAAFETVVKEGLKLKVNSTKSFRAGKRIPERPRLLIVTIDTMEAKLDLLSKVSQLKDTRWSNIYINPDLTKEEREEGKKLRAELKSRREAGEANLTIRRGKVVSLSRRSANPPNLSQTRVQDTISTPAPSVREAEASRRD